MTQVIPAHTDYLSYLVQTQGEGVLQEIASWPKPNYKNPITRSKQTLGVGGAFLGLSTLAVIARLYARIVIRRWFGLDDACIVVAYVRFHSTYAFSYLKSEDIQYWCRYLRLHWISTLWVG